MIRPVVAGVRERCAHVSHPLSYFGRMGPSHGRPPSSRAQSGTPIKIGYSMPLTGGLAANGRSACSRSASGRTKLLDIDRVDLIIGAYGTALTAPAMPIIELLCPFVGVDDLSGCVFRRRDYDLRGHILELSNVVSFYVLILHLENPRLRPFALCAELDVS